MKRIVIPDIHTPFQDKPLVRACLDFVEKEKPDGLDFIGDVIDCYSISRFDKNPARKATLQQECDEAAGILSCFDAAAPSRCDKRMSEGNHEDRIRRLLWGKAKELADIRGLSLQKLLRLDDFDIKLYDPNAPYSIGPLHFIHGDMIRKSNWSITAGGTAAGTAAKRIGGSIIMGHTHQMGMSCFRSWKGNWEGYECGCLCRLDQDYVMGVPQWQQGWAVIHFLPKGAFSVEFVRVASPTGSGPRYVVYRDKVIARLPRLRTKLTKVKS